MKKIIAITNQKGGVAKTTTAVNLATALAAVGQKPLVIDLDPQGNATTGFGVDKNAVRHNIYHVLIGEATLADAVAETCVPGLSLIPSNTELSGAEVELAAQEDGGRKLHDVLEGSDLSPWDILFIDCPPGIGFLTLNALTAARSYLIPLQCEFYALEGLSHLTRFIQRVQAKHNTQLELEGVLLTMHDSRTALSDQVVEDVRAHFGDKAYSTVIPRNVKIAEAPSHGKPVLLYDHRCSGAEAYTQLAGEMLRRSGTRL